MLVVFCDIKLLSLHKSLVLSIYIKFG